MGSTIEQVDVVVVGAGWNGLISAKTYLDFRPTANLVVLDEQASIGGVWSEEKIYPSLYAQIKHGLFEYSFYPMRHEGITEDGYISGNTIHTYLNDFAWDFDLVRRIRLQTTVANVSRAPSGGWHLEIVGKPPIECTKLIYASGATSHPVVPTWPTDNFRSPVIHSSELGSHLDALNKIGSATVIGGAKSSYDTVFFLLNAGKKVNWIIREDGSGPLAIMPPLLFGSVNTMDIVTSRFVTLMGSSIMSTDGIGHQFFQRTLLGRFIAWVFWLVVNWIADRHAGYSKSENAKKLRPMPHGNGIFWAHAGLGAASVPLFWKTFHAGDCSVHRTDIDSLRENNIISLKDGTQFSSDYLILCTGFDKSFQVFDEKLQQECGLMPDPAQKDRWAKLESDAEEKVDELLPAIANSPLTSKQFDREKTAGGRKLLHGPSRHYRRLIVPSLAAQGDRSVYFPGFIHSIYTPVVSEVQALWGVAFLLGMHNPPGEEEMEREVAEWNVWSRKRYVAQGKKHAYAIYDFLPYIDLLLKDLGINPHRKTGFFNMFNPSYPSEYKGLIDEFHRVAIEKQVVY
ncbi:cofactor FMO1 FAD enzyme [Annulohypoxylon maeteangense]|uniref:cofactor FMO1 FAD enzyme n=1 Tax=Annulohypoxylon maeteangense TaxID=1927788 RepID=UPI002007F652|nr:cofactor FMO1 FAD enzyme [Annulohypoxylon maeteangense]KAI0886567.1 cofactor FMO1 FAD enzyme [Annulohypoxylon maeteangense]